MYFLHILCKLDDGGGEWSTTVIVKVHFAVFFSHKVLLTDHSSCSNIVLCFRAKIYQTKNWKLKSISLDFPYFLATGWDSSHQSRHCPSGFSPLKRLSDKSSLRKCDRKGDDSTGTACQCQQRKLQHEFHFTAKGESYTGSMRNNFLKWHYCLTHKTLQCIYDDLTGRLGGSAWVCIWETGGIRPLTQSNECCCIYSLADSLMFFSQRLAASIFFLVEAEEWGGRC